MPTPAATLTTARAAAHEALFLKLSALLAQAEKTALRYPDRAVPAATLSVAEALLSAAARFFVVGRRRDRLPMAAPVWGGLYSQLGQALAALDHFEAQHSRWDKATNAQVWQTAGGTSPVRRLRPMITPTQRDVRRNMKDARQKLAQRLEQIGVAIPGLRAKRRRDKNLSPGSPWPV